MAGMSSRGLNLSPFTDIALERIWHRRYNHAARMMAAARGRAECKRKAAAALPAGPDHAKIRAFLKSKGIA